MPIDPSAYMGTWMCGNIVERTSTYTKECRAVNSGGPICRRCGFDYSGETGVQGQIDRLMKRVTELERDATA